MVTPFSKSKDSCRSDQLKLSFSSLSLSGRGKPRSSTSHSAFKFALPDSDAAVIDVASSSVSLPPFLSLSLKDVDGLSFI